MVFFKADCHANPSAKSESEQDQSVFQETYFEISQIGQLTIMYHFEHVNHDNPLIFLFQNLFECVYSAPVISSIFK